MRRDWWQYCWSEVIVRSKLSWNSFDLLKNTIWVLILFKHFARPLLNKWKNEQRRIIVIFTVSIIPLSETVFWFKCLQDDHHQRSSKHNAIRTRVLEELISFMVLPNGITFFWIVRKSTTSRDLQFHISREMMISTISPLRNILSISLQEDNKKDCSFLSICKVHSKAWVTMKKMSLLPSTSSRRNILLPLTKLMRCASEIESDI